MISALIMVHCSIKARYDSTGWLEMKITQNVSSQIAGTRSQSAREFKTIDILSKYELQETQMQKQERSVEAWLWKRFIRFSHQLRFIALIRFWKVM